MATKRMGNPSTKKAEAKKSNAKEGVVKSTTKTTTRKAVAGKAAHPIRKTVNRWSKRVVATSDAMDLEPNILKLKSAKKIGLSLERSAGQNHRRKVERFQSAMSMFTFYINRGGRNLSANQIKILERAKDELWKTFRREEGEQKHA